ncbi:MAG TPA: patatin-like phospholipase family protein [Candidatus Tumulicola sp.]|jgi:predicted acylesterase/phospholipase RssA
MKRSQFVLTAGAASTLPFATPKPASAADEFFEPIGRALVLSGGGARGAYEAGIIGALAAANGLSDGQPLPEYGGVCGTSIGALNGWFVATGQYSKLKELWYGISAQNLIRLKPRYSAIRDPESGLLNRMASVVGLYGLTDNQSGVLQSQPVLDWITRNIDPKTPLVVPFVFAVTNLTQQRPEYFYMRPGGYGQELPELLTRALQLSLGPHTVVREATPDLVHRAIFASAALPVVFDPVALPAGDGTNNAYCDGGVASNSPVGVAHSIASAADVILLDPPFEPEPHYTDALEVAYAVFGTMQRKILEVEMRTAYFQSLGKRALERIPRTTISSVTGGDELLDRFMRGVPATVLRYIRPKSVLEVSVIGFGDEVGIGKAYRTGWEDARRGFLPYDWQTFAL